MDNQTKTLYVKDTRFMSVPQSKIYGNYMTHTFECKGDSIPEIIIRLISYSRVDLQSCGLLNRTFKRFSQILEQQNTAVVLNDIINITRGDYKGRQLIKRLQYIEWFPFIELDTYKIVEYSREKHISILKMITGFLNSLYLFVMDAYFTNLVLGIQADKCVLDTSISIYDIGEIKKLEPIYPSIYWQVLDGKKPIQYNTYIK